MSEHDARDPFVGINQHMIIVDYCFIIEKHCSLWYNLNAIYGLMYSCVIP